MLEIFFFSGNKAVMKTKREEALLYLQKKAEKQEEEKREIKEKNKKYSLKEMMKVAICGG